MLVISNNLIGKMPIPKDAVVRVNLAWVNLYEARAILQSSKHNIYLDYPFGRAKPPKSVITLDEAISLANDFNVRYFAVSNVEDVKIIRDLNKRVKPEIVPKIETVKGVKNIQNIAKEVSTIMLDVDDLWIDCKGKNWYNLIKRVKSAEVNILELAAVIFYDNKGKKS